MKPTLQGLVLSILKGFAFHFFSLPFDITFCDIKTKTHQVFYIITTDQGISLLHYSAKSLLLF